MTANARKQKQDQGSTVTLLGLLIECKKKRVKNTVASLHRLRVDVTLALCGTFYSYVTTRNLRYEIGKKKQSCTGKKKRRRNIPNKYRVKIVEDC